MSTYAIGDVQGCFATLQALLKKIDFHSQRDTLWFVGDLVNRGADSLSVLRFVRDLGERAVTVLGNHDLHLLAIAAGIAKGKKGDTLEPVLEAADRDELLTWLRQRPLWHMADRYALVHAGLHPAWDWMTAQTLAYEVEQILRGADYVDLLRNMYGDEPRFWTDSLSGPARHRFVLNIMTRMRVLSKDGGLDLAFKGGLSAIPSSHQPWFDSPTSRKPLRRLLVGHWSALGLRVAPQVVSLDTGCVWGRELSAYRLDDHRIFQQPSVETSHSQGRD